jgi:Bacteriophage lambda head decoration protein D
MTTFTEGRHANEGIMSEAEFGRSREAVTIVSGSGVIKPGAVLGKYTSGANSGKYSLAPAAAADPDVGNQSAVAVALYGCDATAADQKIAVIARDAQVNGNMLSYDSSVDTDNEKAAKAVQLAAVGIIVRN